MSVLCGGGVASARRPYGSGVAAVWKWYGVAAVRDVWLRQYGSGVTMGWRWSGSGVATAWCSDDVAAV